jgi:hypothetical protein
MGRILLLVLLLLIGCAKVHNGPRGEPGPKGDSGDRGPEGAAGRDGNDAYAEVVPLCPNLAGAYPEVLLRISGKLYAVFAPGTPNVRLVEIVPGSYVTTDGRSCSFTVTAELEVL